MVRVYYLTVLGWLLCAVLLAGCVPPVRTESVADKLAVASATVTALAKTTTAAVNNQTLALDTAIRVQKALQGADDTLLLAESRVAAGKPESALELLLAVNTTLTEITAILEQEMQK